MSNDPGNSFFIPPFKRQRNIRQRREIQIPLPQLEISEPKSEPLSPSPLSDSSPELSFPGIMDIYSKIEHAAKLIPEFNGDPEELNKFISCVDRIDALCTSNDEKSLLVNYILFKLGNKVYNIIANAKPNTWEEIKSHLSKFYKIDDTFDDIERKVSSLTFEPLYESIQDYYLRTENLVSRYQKLLRNQCNIGDSEKARAIAEKRIVPRFIIGLPDKIRNFVRVHQNEPLRRCMEAAVQEINFEKHMHEDENWRAHATTSRGTFPHVPAVAPTIVPIRNIPPRFCIYCRRNGHTVGECRTKRRNESCVPNYHCSNSSFANDNNSINPDFSLANIKPAQPTRFQEGSATQPPVWQWSHSQRSGNQQPSQISLNSQQPYYQIPSDSLNRSHQAQPTNWREPNATSTPNKNRYTRGQPDRPTNNTTINDITNAFRGLGITNRPNNSLSSGNPQICHFTTQNVNSENFNGLDNA